MDQRSSTRCGTGMGTRGRASFLLVPFPLHLCQRAGGIAPFLRSIGKAPEQLAEIEFDVAPPKPLAQAKGNT